MIITTYRRLGEVLVSKNAITNLQLSVALADQRVSNRRLGDILVERGFTTEQEIAVCLAHQYNYPLIDIETATYDPSVIRKLSAEDALQLRALPISESPDGVVVAIGDPIDVVATDRLAALIGQRILLSVAPAGRLLSRIRAAYGLNDDFSPTNFPETTKAPERYQSLVSVMRFGPTAVFAAKDGALDRKVTLVCTPTAEASALEQLKVVKAAARGTTALSCPVHDSFVDKDYRWTVLGPLDGENLEQVLRTRGARSVPQAADLVSKVAEALDDLHRSGSVCDWACPANIFVGTHGPLLAPIVHAPSHYLDGSPNDSEWSGAPGVYALGRLLSECLNGLDNLAKSTVPGPMEDILANCLAEDSKNRYSSPIEVASVLRGFNWQALTNPVGRSAPQERQQLLDILDQESPQEPTAKPSFWARWFGKKAA